MIDIDIIILSYAKDEYLKGLTQQTIETLLASEDSKEINFKVLVVESEKTIAPYQFPGSKTIYPKEKFGFHKYLNIGIKETSAHYVCLCNNDLIFHKGWASEILKVLKMQPEIKSANPICPIFEPTKKYQNNKGYILGTKTNLFVGVLTGWCIFTKRELFSKIGFLDENFVFWYADRDYGMTLLKYKLKHALILDSKVTHLGNQSYGIIQNLNKFTFEQEKFYVNKWKFRIWYYTLLAFYKKLIK